MRKSWFVICAVASAADASALQPLDEFLRGARSSNVDNLEALALKRQSRGQATAELGRALPGVELRGTYTRNEFETTLDFPALAGAPPTRVVITPKDQLDGTATLDVPLVDLSSWARIAAARTNARAASTEAVSTDLRVQSFVAQEYHQLVANLALAEAARRSLEVARESLRIAQSREEAGAVGPLDVDRAQGEVERNVQQVASAELEVAVVARALESATGITPDLAGAAPLGDDLHEEPPLGQFQPADDRIPGIAAAMQTRAAFEQQARAQRLTLLPRLSGAVTQRWTDAEGFAGREAWWTAVVGLTWNFDLSTIGNIRAQDAAAQAARAREQRVRLAARDEIHRNWVAVRTNIARGRSARVQAEVSARAAQRALNRYQVGEAAQLDLLQAQRDAFAAEAARIQAYADLVNSRAQLRLAAGESLLAIAPEGGGR
jgi:outer membrane protein TolC